MQPSYPNAAMNRYSADRKTIMDTAAAAFCKNSIILSLIPCPFRSASSVPVDHPRQTAE